MMPLEMEQGFNRRRFYLGLILFILYLLAYAVIIFVAEMGTKTGMNEYKESVWFALITVTTLGYGDITAQLPPCKYLNACFICFNMIIIATMLNDFISSIVGAGEEQLNHRMGSLMNGQHDVFQHKNKRQQSFIKKIARRRRDKKHNRHRKALSVGSSVDIDAELREKRIEAQERTGRRVSAPNVALLPPGTLLTIAGS